MRRAFLVLAIAGLSACANTLPTDVSAGARDLTADLLPNNLYLSMPDSLTADETGACNFPITWTSTYSGAVSFGNSQVQVGTTTYNVSTAIMDDVSGGPIPANSSGGGILYDADLTGTARHALYSGSLYVTWSDPGGTSHYTFLPYTCYPRRIGH